MPPEIKSVNVITPDGDVVSIPESALPAAIREGYSLESAEGEIARASREGKIEGLGVNTPLGKVKAVASEVLGGASLGLTNIAQASDPRRREEMQLAREESPTLTTGANVFGALGTALLSGGAGAAGAAARATPSGALAARTARIASAVPEAGAVARIGRSALSGALEGTVQTAGQVASDLALSDDPVTMDRIASAIPNIFLYGGVAGGLGGAAVGGLDVAMTSARRHLGRAQEAASKVSNIPDDIATADRKGLHAAEKVALDAIEAERVGTRAKLADDINAFRETTKIDQPWTAVATGSKAGKKAIKAAIAAGEEVPQKYPRWVREYEAIYKKADIKLDTILNNPKRLAKRPWEAEAALQQQEHALEMIQSRSEELRVLHTADKTGRRAAALESIPKALEANRALQLRIGDITAPPASPRLTQVRDALVGYDDAKKLTLGQKLGGAVAFGATTAALSGVNVPGMNYIAPVLGAAAGSTVAGKLAGKMAGATRIANERTARAVDAFISGTRKVGRAVPIVASRVLSEARFGDERPATTSTRKKTLEDHFHERADEIAASVVPGPDGKPKVRLGTRQQIAERLRAVAAFAPHLADKLETHAVRRLELLAAKMPKPTQIGMTRIPPPEMAIRAFARYVAAADDPGGIEERLADGTITPEDAEVMRELFPDRMAHMMSEIATKMAAGKKLPYERRIALAIFTGAPVDASLDPRVLPVLQQAHQQEENTEGGTEAPRPAPAFASVQKSIPTPTPAQERAG